MIKVMIPQEGGHEQVGEAVQKMNPLCISPLLSEVQNMPTLISIADLRQLILSRRRDFPKQITRVLVASLERPEFVAFATVKSLAEASGVGDATVLRTVRSLGFTNFAEFRILFQNWLRQASPK